MKIIHLFRLTQRQIQIRSYRQQSPQEVQARVRVLVTHRVHLGGEQVGITARLQDINNLDTAVQCNHNRYQTQVVSKYLIQCLDDVTWLVFLSGQDYVDHLGDGSLYGERIVFTTWRSLYQWSSVGWKYQLPIKWWSKQILSKQE